MSLDWNNLLVVPGNAAKSCWQRGVSLGGNWHQQIVRDNDLWIILNGSAVMQTSTGSVPLQSGSIIWMRPLKQYPVVQKPDDPLSLFYLHFELLRPDGSKYYPSLEEIPEVLHAGAHAQWSMMANSIVKLQREHDPAASGCAAVMLKALLMSLDHYLLHNDRTSMPRRSCQIALEAADILENANGGFEKIEHLARRFHLTRGAFTRIFSEYWQISPHAYQINCRMESAKQLLLNSDLRINEIASQLGYPDCYFFNRQFKKAVGTTPAGFRKENTFVTTKQVSINEYKENLLCDGGNRGSINDGGSNNE